MSTLGARGGPILLSTQRKTNCIFHLHSDQNFKPTDFPPSFAQGTVADSSGASFDRLWLDAVKPLPKVELGSVDGLHFELHHTALSLNYYLLMFLGMNKKQKVSAKDEPASSSKNSNASQVL